MGLVSQRNHEGSQTCRKKWRIEGIGGGGQVGTDSGEGQIKGEAQE